MLQIPDDLEVGYVPLSLGGAYPGLYLFTSPARFVRPVRNILGPEKSQNIELVGPFEQVNIYLAKVLKINLGFGQHVDFFCHGRTY